MNPETAKRSPWQLSLANILTFVLAVGAWGLLVTRGAILERPYITVAVLIATTVCGFVAHRRQRRAATVLIALFLFVVLFSHLHLRVRQVGAIKDRMFRSMTLTTIQTGMQMYVAMQQGEIPPDKSMDSAGAELHRALLTRLKDSSGRVYGPFVAMPQVRVEKGVSYLVGGRNARVIWAKLPDGRGILIDTGPDNLPGGTLSTDGIYTPGPVDANGDGTNDGVDDLAVFSSAPAK